MGGTWGFKGALKRVLELPAAFGAAVSPPGRMRFRYNEVANQVEVSLNGAAYVPLSPGSGFTPAYGELYVVDNVTPQALTDQNFHKITAYDTAGPASGVVASIASDTLTPASQGTYRVQVCATLIGDNGVGYSMAVFDDDVVTHVQAITGNVDGVSAREITCSGFIEDPGALDVRFAATQNGSSIVLITSQFTVEKIAD